MTHRYKIICNREYHRQVKEFLFTFPNPNVNDYYLYKVFASLTDEDVLVLKIKLGRNNIHYSNVHPNKDFILDTWIKDPILRNIN